MLVWELCCSSLLASDSRINWVIRANEANRDAVVCIQGEKVEEASAYSKEAAKTFNGMGTGVIIDHRGYIVTNYHVVDGIRKIQVTTFDRNRYIASLVARDPETDIAIIKVQTDKPLQTIRLGRSNDLMPGEQCMAIGNPFGYDYTVTDGRVSGLGRDVDVIEPLVYKDAIQTSTEINPGNSGGPLINVDGEMIGLNAAIRQGTAGIAFAIPVDQVVDVAAKLIGEIAERSGYLGAEVIHRDASDESEKSFSKSRFSPRTRQVVVESVDSNSPAAQAGLKTGDRVVRVGDFELNNKLDFYRALLDVRSRDDVVFVVARNGDSHDLAVTMAAPREVYSTVRTTSRNRRGSQPSRAEVAPKTGQQAKPVNTLDELVWQTLGIRYTPMAKDEYQKKFAQHLSEHPYGGVMVKSVREGSPMAEKGVMPEDVVVGIHEWAITSSNDVRYIAKSWSTIKAPGNKVRVLLFRDGQSFFTDISLK